MVELAGSMSHGRVVDTDSETNALVWPSAASKIVGLSPCGAGRCVCIMLN